MCIYSCKNNMKTKRKVQKEAILILSAKSKSSFTTTIGLPTNQIITKFCFYYQKYDVHLNNLDIIIYCNFKDFRLKY